MGKDSKTNLKGREDFKCHWCGKTLSKEENEKSRKFYVLVIKEVIDNNPFIKFKDKSKEEIYSAVQEEIFNPFCGEARCLSLEKEVLTKALEKRFSETIKN